MNEEMVEIHFRTSKAFKNLLKDMSSGKQSLSTLINDKLRIAFVLENLETATIDIDKINGKIKIIQSTINALNDNAMQMSSRLDSHLKNTSNELDKTIKELIKELDEILSKSKTAEEKHYALLDEQIYRLQIIAFNIYRLHFTDEIEMKKAVKQCLKDVKEKVTQFKQDNTMRAV